MNLSQARATLPTYSADMFSVSGVSITGVGFHAPGRVFTNADLVGGLETSDSWIRDNLGIVSRRFIDHPDETVLDLARVASQRALSSAALDASDLTGVIVATTTAPMRAPSTACQVAGQLGISTGAFAFDVQAVCSGFLYGLTIAANLLGGLTRGHILVIGADAFSQITDFGSRNCVYFGDGAGAAVLTKEAGSPDNLFVSTLRADGRDAEGFRAEWGKPFDMRPKAVYDHATSVLPKAIEDVVAAAKMSLDDVDYIVPHQPSMRVLQALGTDLGVDDTKVLKNMSHFANTAAGTIPILLAENAEAGTFTPGMTLVLAAVGSGWTWGATVLRWEGTRATS